MSTSQLMVEERTGTILGTPMRRIEDARLVTGAGRFVADIRLSGMLHAAFLRSTYAHAKIMRIDTGRALQHPLARLILTGADLEGHLAGMPTAGNDAEKKDSPRPVLAVHEVNYVGEAVAVVIAEDAYAAEDILELIEVEYEPLPAVTGMDEALKPGSPRVHDYLPDNLAYHTMNRYGDVERVFREADEIVRLKLTNQRIAAIPLESRGVLASYDSGTQVVTVRLSTQDPHGIRLTLAQTLKLPETRVRVIAPDVGGGFGAKFSSYPEEMVVAYASMVADRPVRWIESRRENLLSMTHARGQEQYVEAAVRRRDGRLLGLKVKIVSDGGAYNTASGWSNPYWTAMIAPGCYDVQAYEAEVDLVFTNKVPQDAYRGAGRPEANYLIERTMDIIARRLRLDPVKIRVANFIKKDAFPFKTVSGLSYDSGDYEGTLMKALEVADYDGIRAARREARATGRLVGVGIASWVDVTGTGREGAQCAAVSVTGNGKVIVTIGGHPHGQGHATSAVQIASQVLGVAPEEVTVNYGDTSLLPWSSGTGGSASSSGTGSAVFLSASKIKEKMGKIASKMLDAGDARMQFQGGQIYPASSPGKTAPFKDVAGTAYQPHKLPRGMEPTLFEYTAFAPSDFVYPFGTHVAVVEVDRDTGATKLLQYIGVDDCGKVINPLIVEGQFHGGALQGIGQAMLEEIVYDDSGQLLTSTLADYVIPSADSIPRLVYARTETPTDRNPLGVKGIGEGPTVVAGSAVMNAVDDALSGFGVTVEKMPLRHDYIRGLIGAAPKGDASDGA